MGTNSGRVIVGMDPSFSGFGISVGERTTSFASRGETLRQKCASLYVAIAAFLEPVKLPMLWIIEKPFIVAGKGTKDRNPLHPFNMGYLMSHIDDLAEALEAETVQIDHGKLKIFVAGMGNAKKEDMATYSFEKWGLRFRNNNECDAHALYQFGLAHLRGETPGVHPPKAKKVKVPA